MRPVIHIAAALCLAAAVSSAGNGDLLFNDRPAGVERNTLRGAVQGGPGGQFSYSIPLRKRTGTLPPGIQVSNNNGAVTVNQFSDAARYWINLIAQAQNLTNHANYMGYSGVLGSRGLD